MSTFAARALSQKCTNRGDDLYRNITEKWVTTMMSYAGYKRPGGGGGGALVQVKRPRQDLVVAGGDARSRQLVQSVSSRECLNNAHHTGYPLL